MNDIRSVDDFNLLYKSTPRSQSGYEAGYRAASSQLVRRYPLHCDGGHHGCARGKWQRQRRHCDHAIEGPSGRIRNLKHIANLSHVTKVELSNVFGCRN